MNQSRGEPSRYESAWQERTPRRDERPRTEHGPSGDGARAQPSLGELFSDLSRETRTLVSQEMQLARVELKERASQAGQHAASMAVGGAILYAGFLGLMIAAIVILAAIMEVWLAATLVGLVLVVAGGIFIYSGYNGMKQLDMTPRRTADTLEENAQWLKRELS